MTGGDPLRFAIGTYTRVPVAPPVSLDAAVAGRGLALGPLVGAAIGLVAGLPLLVSDGTALSQLLTATLTVALAAWLTRGLHWDGLADLADGLGSGEPAEQARAIMRRSDVGPFGVLTLVLVLAVQAISLAMLPARSPAWAGWMLAVVMGRFAIALACGPWARPARPDGLGALVAGSVTARRLGAATLLTGVVAIVQVASGYVPAWVGLVAVPGCCVVLVAGLGGVARRRLGGITGDVLGATAELATATVLVVLALA